MIEELTPDIIRRDLIEPLLAIAAELSETARELDQARTANSWKYDVIPVNSKLARDAIEDLKTFMEQRWRPRVRGVKRGTYAYQRHHQERKKSKKQSREKQ